MPVKLDTSRTNEQLTWAEKNQVKGTLGARAQPGRGLRGLKPSLSQVKVKKKIYISDSFVSQ